MATVFKTDDKGPDIVRKLNSFAGELEEGMGDLTQAVEDAEAAAVQSGEYRDEANLAAEIAARGGIYSTIGEGIANVPEGAYFSVPSDDADEYLILYRHEAGPVATEIKRYPSAAAVSGLALQVQSAGGNNRVVDDFQNFPVAPVYNASSGAASSIQFTPNPSGGADIHAPSSSAYYLCETVYRRRPEGIDRFTVTAKATSGTSNNQNFGLGFGNDASDWEFFVWGRNGALVRFSNAGSTSEVLSSGDPTMVYANGQTVSLWVEALPDGRARLGVRKVSGVVQHFALLRPVPTGKVFISVRGATGIWHFDSIAIDGATAPASDASVGADWVDIFPDPTISGRMKSTIWTGTTAIEDGEYVMTTPAGGGSVNSWRIPCVDQLIVGSAIVLQCEVQADVSGANTARSLFVFRDSAQSEISRTGIENLSAADTWIPRSLSAVVPNGCAYVDIWLGSGAASTQTKYRRVRLYSSSARQLSPFPAPSESSVAIVSDRRVFVSTAGSDSNSGSDSSPLATLAAAIASEKLSGGGDIILLNGEYLAAVDLSSLVTKGPVSIQSRYNDRARLVAATALTGITKTIGQNKVYQASLAASPGEWVWQHGVEDARTIIPLSERSAYQKGRTNRLPSTKIRKVASIAAIDASTDDDPCWYWSSGVLYFSIYGGGDGSAADIRVPRNGNAVACGAGQSIEMIGIDVWYGALSFTSVAKARLNDVFAFGTRGNAIAYNRSGDFVTTCCEAAGSENDGFNSHNDLNPNYRDSVGLHRGAWSHDNLGDGHSDHACSLIQFDGGLYEYNGKAGIVPANGSHAVARNAHARGNGWNTPNGGGGFAITNATSAWDTGVGTQFDLYECVSEANAYNFMCGPAAESGGGSGGTTDANHAMRVYGGISRNSIVAGYYARVGRLEATDCRDLGSVVPKLEQGGGSIIVVTTAPLE